MFKRYEQNENCAQDVDLDANAFLIVANDANAAIHPITPWPPGFTEDLLWWSQVRDISRVVARLPRSEAKTGGGGSVSFSLDFRIWNWFLVASKIRKVSKFHELSTFPRIICLRRLSSNKSSLEMVEKLD